MTSLKCKDHRVLMRVRVWHFSEIILSHTFGSPTKQPHQRACACKDASDESPKQSWRDAPEKERHTFRG